VLVEVQLKAQQITETTQDVDARVARLLARESDIKQVRIDDKARTIDVGFYGEPTKELLRNVEAAVRHEFIGNWKLSTHSESGSGQVHHHKVNDHIEEFHRAHPQDEPEVVWKHLTFPKWRNRPVPPAMVRDYRVMLTLAGACGLSALAGFVLDRSHHATGFVAPFFIIAYIFGGWFATQDVCRGLKRGRIDVQFLMIFVALGAVFVRAWTEGATLLFLFSLSNALEQFANHRTNKAIGSLLKAAPKRALRRESGEWIESSDRRNSTGR
jgi:Cd2+/Zn2+-exporting ATPase